jgi:hypothetical protein
MSDPQAVFLDPPAALRLPQNSVKFDYGQLSRYSPVIVVYDDEPGPEDVAAFCRALSTPVETENKKDF